MKKEELFNFLRSIVSEREVKRSLVEKSQKKEMVVKKAKKPKKTPWSDSEESEEDRDGDEDEDEQRDRYEIHFSDFAERKHFSGASPFETCCQIRSCHLSGFKLVQFVKTKLSLFLEYQDIIQPGLWLRRLQEDSGLGPDGALQVAVELGLISGPTQESSKYRDFINSASIFWSVLEGLEVLDMSDAALSLPEWKYQYYLDLKLVNYPTFCAAVIEVTTNITDNREIIQTWYRMINQYVADQTTESLNEIAILPKDELFSLVGTILSKQRINPTRSKRGAHKETFSWNEPSEKKLRVTRVTRVEGDTPQRIETARTNQKKPASLLCAKIQNFPTLVEAIDEVIRSSGNNDAYYDEINKYAIDKTEKRLGQLADLPKDELTMFVRGLLMVPKPRDDQQDVRPKIESKKANVNTGV
eukprot:TRINITY_DN4780_c0_g1_i1.p1 TRINITY_DN4780_c0_g1~~TRINITY_DN4780_c0_g1_i1.p1  ORF type:complete len:468 (+),score=102.33 TRINITY_DN4780_c0_g1_i1:163-1404(+)